jgi:hypothetical protein
MTPCLVFNHHSLPFATANDADNAIPNFLKVCIKSQNVGLATIIVDETVDRDWFRLELSEGYFWQDWHRKNQYGGSRDIIRAFRSLATRQPFFSTEDIENGVDLFEVSLNKKKKGSRLCLTHLISKMSMKKKGSRLCLTHLISKMSMKVDFAKNEMQNEMA